MDIVVDVINQKLRIATNLRSLVSGSQNYIKFVFNLPTEWDDLTTFVQFQQNDHAYNVYLDANNSAYLPSNIGAGNCTMLLYGSAQSVIATTNYLTLMIDDNIMVVNAESTDVSTSLYQQLVDRQTALESQMDTVESIVEAFENDPVVLQKINAAVAAKMAEYIQNGTLSRLQASITDDNAGNLTMVFATA